MMTQLSSSSSPAGSETPASQATAMTVISPLAHRTKAAQVNKRQDLMSDDRGEGPSSTAIGQGDMKPTCFIFARGNQDLSEYELEGRFAAIKQLKTYVWIFTHDHGRDTFICFADKRDAIQAMTIYRRYRGFSGVDAKFLSVEEYCYASRTLLNPFEPSNVGETYMTGYPGELFVVVSSGQKMSFNDDKVKAYIASEVEDSIAFHADIEAFAEVFHGYQEYMHFRVSLFVPSKADEIVKHFRKATADIREDGLTFKYDYYRSITNFQDVGVDMNSGRDTDFLAPATADNSGFYGAVGSSRPMNGTNGHTTPGNVKGKGKDISPVAISSGSAGMSLVVTPDTPMTFTPFATPVSAPVMGAFAAPGRAAFTTPAEGLDHRLTTPAEGFERSRRRDYTQDFDRFGDRREFKNVIDIQMIHTGRDVRTTVMLRNIPNRLTHEQLRRVLNDHVFGRYDFLYLRIDFANNCNVGYGFINFNHPLDVAMFVQAVGGQKWMHSDKVVEVSYASMQGRETLVAKFRNSSVMLQPVMSRPKPDLMAGQEEPFPAPDNDSKLARSRENAEQIGLYSPARGGSGVEHRISRHGRYDRGTSYAIIERLAADNARLQNTLMRGRYNNRQAAYH